MKLVNVLVKLVVMIACIAMLGACTKKEGAATAGAETQGTTEQSFNLKLGHNMAEDHAVHIQLAAFVKDVAEKTGGTVNISIVPNGVLGTEADMLQQVQMGALDMTKVSAFTMGNFSKLYNVYAVPYVFDNQEHYYNVMDSAITQKIFDSTRDAKFIGLTWLDSGARSFYTVNKPIRVPADLKGLKIRTMDSQIAIEMMKALGGSATVMAYGDIYTGLQSGVIDGAENNITALRDHGEVAKFYSFDEHNRVPDIVVISASVWDKLSDNQKAIVKEAAMKASNEYKAAWMAFEEKVAADAVNKLGVTLVRDVDIPAFQAAVQPIYDRLKANDPEVYGILSEIRAMAPAPAVAQEAAPEAEPTAEAE